jgi:hypothetical protein
MQVRLVCLERITGAGLEEQVLIGDKLNFLQANDLESAALQVTG